MGIFCCQTCLEKKYPQFDILELDEETDKLLKNKIGPVNFKDLFMESVSPKFEKLFKDNENLFYANSFLEGQRIWSIGKS